MTEEVSLDVVMARRFELVDAMGVIAGRHKAELAPLGEELSLCETFIKDTMNKAGMQQAKTEAGMAFFTSKDSCSVTDMDAVVKFMVDATPAPDYMPNPQIWQDCLDWVTQHGMWGLLNKAVNKTAARELTEANKAPPPGIKFESYRDLGWRRNTK